MTHKKIAMEHDKKIALVAHDNKKRDLVEWAKIQSSALGPPQDICDGNNRRNIGKRTRLQSQQAPERAIGR